MIFCIILCFMRNLFFFVKVFHQYLPVSITRLRYVAWIKRIMLALMDTFNHVYGLPWMLFAIRTLSSVMFILFNQLVLRFSHIIVRFLRLVSYRSAFLNNLLTIWCILSVFHNSPIRIIMTFIKNFGRTGKDVLACLLLSLFLICNTGSLGWIWKWVIIYMRRLQSFRKLRM